MEKFIITPKEDTSVTMTIRIDRALQEEYNELAAKTNRSRNELICMALKYALNNMELKNQKILVYKNFPFFKSILKILLSN